MKRSLTPVARLLDAVQRMRDAEAMNDKEAFRMAVSDAYKAWDDHDYQVGAEFGRKIPWRI